ncbi:hypothetical protein, partial [Paludisphaera sp.]|uniref:hypothetical protein n=1 Tax=Paludisphaera sp. TaxID=2017432 RepID=UPI00301BC5E4
MPVTKITQKIDGLSGGWSLDGGFNLAVSVYIQCTPGTDPEAMLRSLGLPVGATYRFPLTGTPTATNPRLFLESISIDSVDGDGAGAHLTAKFTPADPSKDDRGPVDEHGNRDPFAAPPKLRWATEAEEFAVTHDKAGQPILNAAGEPYESGVVIPLSTPIAVVSRLAREFDEAWLDVYKGRINSVPW